MCDPTEDLVSCERELAGFKAYAVVRARGTAIPEFARTLGLDVTILDRVFGGSAGVPAPTVATVLDSLRPEIDDIAKPEASEAFTLSAGRLSARQRQLVAWRLYVHLRANGLARRSLANRAGVVERTLDRVLTIDHNVSFDTVARIVAEAGLALEALVAWPPRDAMASLRGGGAGRASPPRKLTDDDPTIPNPLEQGPARSPTHARVTAVVIGLVVGAAALLGYTIGRRAEPPSSITLHAPPRALTNEVTVSGNLRSSPVPMAVVLYVRPENSRIYFRQSTEVFLDEGRYQAVVRLGDEHMDQPTLNFRVVAAAVDMGEEDVLPGTFADPAVEVDTEDQFLRRLAGLSAGVSDAVRVTRVAATPPREHARLLKPLSGSHVRSPVRLIWEPAEQPLYVETRTHARLVSEASGAGRASGRSVVLPPGRYELKLRRSPAEPVLAVSIFEVVSAKEKADDDQVP